MLDTAYIRFHIDCPYCDLPLTLNAGKHTLECKNMECINTNVYHQPKVDLEICEKFGTDKSGE